MTDHRSRFRAKMEAALEADERRLAHFRDLWVTAQERQAAAPDNPIRVYQVDALMSIIALSAAKIAFLRNALEEIAPERQED